MLHLKEAKRVLAKGGVYVIDVAFRPAIGKPVKKAENWDIIRHGTRYKIEWSIKQRSRGSGRFLERITVKSGSSRVLSSESETIIRRTAEFEIAVEDAGLHIEHWFKPFVTKLLPKPPTDGRVIAVLSK